MSTHKTNVLLIEDDKVFSEELAEYLEAHDMVVHQRRSTAGVLHELQDKTIDLIILDQFIGEENLLSFVVNIRTFFNGGILFLTSNQNEIDRVIGLELGADDFVSKTQAPREILARLRAVIRRSTADKAASAGDFPTATAAARQQAPDLAGWSLDAAARQLRAPDATVIPLTGMEYVVFHALMINQGNVVSREYLMTDVLNRTFDPGDRNLDNLISRIRAKLRPFEQERSTIQSLRSRGYVFIGFK